MLPATSAETACSLITCRAAAGAPRGALNALFRYPILEPPSTAPHIRQRLPPMLRTIHHAQFNLNLFKTSCSGGCTSNPFGISSQLRTNGLKRDLQGQQPRRITRGHLTHSTLAAIAFHPLVRTKFSNLPNDPSACPSRPRKAFAKILAVHRGTFVISQSASHALSLMTFQCTAFGRRFEVNMHVQLQSHTIPSDRRNQGEAYLEHLDARQEKLILNIPQDPSGGDIGHLRKNV
ncbi:hypothetical protein B0H16DRAFT_1470165 [Mycena metata]|uniref:Uncharacterized protein n=1 Tax=Mycena metata TaxID=1033252 RepID=A0AAD7HXA5_9AGAR|nr:hypothetical protein B0H16DRAFT_1470165 [Mycena metata]